MYFYGDGNGQPGAPSGSVNWAQLGPIPAAAYGIIAERGAASVGTISAFARCSVEQAGRACDALVNAGACSDRQML